MLQFTAKSLNTTRWWRWSTEKFEFDYITKWYMNSPESVLGNETHKILWDFEIKTCHLNLAWGPRLELIMKRMELAV